jgi:arginine repressor
LKSTSRNKETVFRFQTGDRIEGFDSQGVGFQGTVESVARKQRILWIQTEAGQRKLIDATEHSIDRSR